MLFTSNRWLIPIALLVSGALWLAVSSVTANAVHVLAKDGFSWRAFGSVSIWLVATSLAWVIFASYVLSVNSQLPARDQFLGLCTVTIWVGVLLVSTAFGDQFLGGLGGIGLAVWVVEIAGAALLVAYFFRQSVPFVDLQKQALLIAVTLIWLTAAKTAFLCLSPGISIRL
jgi:hypothetical protein